MQSCPAASPTGPPWGSCEPWRPRDSHSISEQPQLQGSSCATRKEHRVGRGSHPARLHNIPSYLCSMRGEGLSTPCAVQCEQCKQGRKPWGQSASLGCQEVPDVPLMRRCTSREPQAGPVWQCCVTPKGPFNQPMRHFTRLPGQTASTHAGDVSAQPGHREGMEPSRGEKRLSSPILVPSPSSTAPSHSLVLPRKLPTGARATQVGQRDSQGCPYNH